MKHSYDEAAARSALWRGGAWAALLALAGCGYAIVSGGRIDQSRAARVVEGIQQIRQLSFKKPVPMVVKTRDEVQRLIIEELRRDYSDEELDADGKAGAMLGLYPPGINLKAETVKLLTAQIAGFYDPDERQMVLVEGAVELGFWDRAFEFMQQRDLVGELLLGHELTHALQDENFGLKEKLKKLRTNGDEELALKSVAEGDATIAGFAYVTGRMDESIGDILTTQLTNLPQLFAAQSTDTPRGLSAPLLFQYTDGVRFVAAAYRRGGWSAVDNLYRDPPRATRQIIDPALYFDHSVAPAEVKVAGYEAALAGWNKVDEDTYGELSLRIILQIALGEDAPEVALARQWAGDRMAILTNGSGVSVVWIIAFRDSESAAQFEAAYVPILDKILGSATPHHVEVASDAVLVIVGNAAARPAALAPAVWRASSIGRPATLPPAPKPERLRTERWPPLRLG